MGKKFFTIMLAQAGAIRWYVDRVEYLSKRSIFCQNSDFDIIESPCSQGFRQQKYILTLIINSYRRKIRS